MAQDIAVGMPVEIIPGITPDIFGGGGVLTRDEYGIRDYQTNIANVERLGSVNNPDLPAGTVLICHGNQCSIYSINHIRPYNPEENNENSGNNRSTVVGNNNSGNNKNQDTKSEYELFGFKLFGGRRRKTHKKNKKTKNHKKTKRSR